MIPVVTPNGVFYLPPTGWLTSFYNPPSKVKLQFIKKNKTEYLYRVYFSLMGRKILYRKIDEQKINLDNLSKVIN